MDVKLLHGSFISYSSLCNGFTMLFPNIKWEQSLFHNLFRCSLFISLRRGNRHLKISIMLFDFRGRYCPVIYVTKMMTANIQLEFLHYMPCIGRNRLFSCDWLSNEHTVTQDRHKMLQFLPTQSIEVHS